jgi:hypothetical protein
LALVVCLPVPISYEGERVSVRRGRLGGFRVGWWTELAGGGVGGGVTGSRQFLYLVTYDRRVSAEGAGVGRVRHDLRCSNVVLVPPLFFFPLWAVGRLVREIREDGRRLKGMCAKCGYDLRASGERCPECGAERRKGG